MPDWIAYVGIPFGIFGLIVGYVLFPYLCRTILEPDFMEEDRNILDQNEGHRLNIIIGGEDD